MLKAFTKAGGCVIIVIVKICVKKEELIVQKAYLILENGTIFEGKSFGAAGEAIGEIVFTTAMTGYLETLTDPSYYGQIVVQTFPLIGNYGVIPEDFESECPHVKAYIVRDWCQEPSNFRCEGDLDTFLKQHNIVGLYGIDTRQLTKIVRESGVMNGKIVPEGSSFGLTDLKNYTIVEAVKNTTCSEEKTFEPEGEVKRKVVLYDFGAKHNIGRELVKRGCEVTVVPAYTKAERIKELAPDGIMLSNGPGDPAENIENNQRAFLGMKNALYNSKRYNFKAISFWQHTWCDDTRPERAHRRSACRHPPCHRRRCPGDRPPVSAWPCLNDSLPEGEAKVLYVNANDGTCEGIRYLNEPAFSVQFHPEACGGPHDTDFLFDEFIELIDTNKK